MASEGLDLQLQIVPNDDGVEKVQVSSPEGDEAGPAAGARSADDRFFIEQESPSPGSDVFLSPKEEPANGTFTLDDDSPTAAAEGDPGVPALPDMQEPGPAPAAQEPLMAVQPQDLLQHEAQLVGLQEQLQGNGAKQQLTEEPLVDEPLHDDTQAEQGHEGDQLQDEPLQDGPQPEQGHEGDQLQDEPLRDQPPAAQAPVTLEEQPAAATPLQPPPSPFFPVPLSSNAPGISTALPTPHSVSQFTERGLPASQNGTTAANLSPPSSPHPMDSIKPPSILQVDASYQGLLFSDGYDTHGRPVIVLNTSALPPKSRKDDVLTYLREQLSPIVEQGPYVLVLLACSSGPKYKSLPSLWTVSAYRSLARPFHKNVKFIIMVNPSLLVRFVLAIIKPFAKKKGYHKLKKVKTLEEIDPVTNGEVRAGHLGQSFLSYVQRLQQNGMPQDDGAAQDEE